MGNKDRYLVESTVTAVESMMLSNTPRAEIGSKLKLAGNTLQRYLDRVYARWQISAEQRLTEKQKGVERERFLLYLEEKGRQLRGLEAWGPLAVNDALLAKILGLEAPSKVELSQGPCAVCQERDAVLEAGWERLSDQDRADMRRLVAKMNGAENIIQIGASRARETAMEGTDSNNDDTIGSSDTD